MSEGKATIFNAVFRGFAIEEHNSLQNHLFYHMQKLISLDKNKRLKTRVKIV